MHPDLKIWGHGTAAALRTWKRSVESKGWKSQFIGGKDCDSFLGICRRFALWHRHRYPRAVHRTDMTGNEWHFMHSTVVAFSEAYEAYEAYQWLCLTLPFMIPIIRYPAFYQYLIFTYISPFSGHFRDGGADLN